MSDARFGIWVTLLAKGWLQPSGQEKNHDGPFREFNFVRSQNVSYQEIQKTRKDPCFRGSICEGPKVVSKSFFIV